MAELGTIIGLIKTFAPKADPAEIEQAVSDWLDDHPEATTTVQDGSITKAKLDNDLQEAVDEIPELSTEITNCSETKTSNAPSVDLDVSDEEGNVIVRFSGGNVKTKNFDSEETTGISNQTTDGNADLYVADSSGNGLIRFSEGNIQTKYFNSDQNEYKKSISYTNTSGVEIIQHFFPKGTKIAFHLVSGAIGSQSLAYNLVEYGYVNASGTSVSLGKDYGFNYFIKELPNDATAVYVSYGTGLLWGESGTLYFSAFSVPSFERQPIKVTVSTDGKKDYTGIRAAVDAVAPYASDYTPYEIYVYPGTYDILSEYTAEEIATNGFQGLFLSNGISLIGVGATSEIVLTAEMSTTDYTQEKRNDVSTLNVIGNVRIENMTVQATNIRYCIHDDKASSFGKKNVRILRNLKLQGFNLTTTFITYGAGGGSGKVIDAKNVDFTNGLHIHNSNGMTKPYYVYLENCTAKRFNFHDYENPGDELRIFMHNCKAPFIEISKDANNNAQKLFVEGTCDGDPMITCPSGYVYSVGNCHRFDDVETTIPVGYAVKIGTTWKKIPAVTTSLDDVYGICIGADGSCTIVQTEGYINSNILGISNVSLGDYLTINTSTGAIITGGTASNAIAQIKYIDYNGVAYAKII